MRDVVHPGRRDRPEANEEASNICCIGWLESASGGLPDWSRTTSIRICQTPTLRSSALGHMSDAPCASVCRCDGRPRSQFTVWGRAHRVRQSLAELEGEAALDREFAPDTVVERTFSLPSVTPCLNAWYLSGLRGPHRGAGQIGWNTFRRLDFGTALLLLKFSLCILWLAPILTAGLRCISL